MSIGKVGVWVNKRSWPTDVGEVGEAFAELEERGFGAVWIGNAEGSLRRPEQVLAKTTRLVVATGVVNIWNDDAATVAAAFHRLNEDHPDRLLLGIGAGHKKFVEQTGQHYTRPYSKVVEYLDQLDEASPPVPPDRRALAALGPRTIQLAADRSAGAHPYLVTPDHTRMAREIIGAGPLLAPEQKVILETDRGRALAIARPAIQTYLGLPNYVANLRRIGFTDDDLSGTGSDRLVEALVAWGDADAIARRVREHYDAGADHVAVQVVTAEPVLPTSQWRELAPALVG